MKKSKKHAPQQNETGSIAEQVPSNKMAKLIEGLAALEPISSKNGQLTSDEPEIMDSSEGLEDWQRRP